MVYCIHAIKFWTKVASFLQIKRIRLFRFETGFLLTRMVLNTQNDQNEDVKTNLYMCYCTYLSDNDDDYAPLFVDVLVFP